MAEYLVKENAGSASREDGRAEKRLGNRCMQESCEVSGHPVNGGQKRRGGREGRRGRGVQRPPGSPGPSPRRPPFRRNLHTAPSAPLPPPSAFPVLPVIGFP